MTVLTDRPGAPLVRAAASSTTVLVHVGAVGDPLVATLDALHTGSLQPDHVIVLDATAAGDAAAACATHPLGEDERLSTVRIPGGTPARAAYGLTTGPDATVSVPEGTTLLWLLAAGHVPERDALRHLADALRRSPSSGVAGPKIVDVADPSRLVALGIASTRSGRVLSTPEPGEPDMGQFDGRTDVLAVSAAGLLVERPLWETLSGFRAAFGDLGADLDLSWRAHLAGSRVLVTPAARMAVTTAAAEGPRAVPAAGDLAVTQADTASRRRAGRRVALARSAWWSAPFLALWILASTLGAALGLLVAKRPRAAVAALADAGALLDPWRSVAARWSARGTRRVARRDLRSLFVAPGEVARHVGDLFFQSVGATGPGSVGADVAPASDDDPVVDIGSIGGRLARSPALWAVLTAVVASAVAWRGVAGGRVEALRSGLVGGELTGARSTPSALFHDWWDGWSGSGLGTGADGSPASLVLAGPAWLVAHTPFLGVTSPAGAAVAVLVAAALPLAVLTAYLSGRVVTASRWPRALVALAWAGSAVASAAVVEGRLGALVVLVVLPPVAAGVTRSLSRRGTTATAATTGLAAVVLGAFAPAVLVVVLAVLVVGIVVAPGAAKVRAVVAGALPVLLLGPWAADLLADPVRILGGPGLLARGTPPPDTLRLGLLFPGGGTSHPWWAAVPLLALALACLVRGRRRGWAQAALGLLAVVGLAATYAAPRLRIGTIPLGEQGAGRQVTPWWGLPMLVCLFAVLAVVLVGLSDLTLRRSRARWRALARWPAVAVLVVVALGGVALQGWYGVHGALRAWSDPRPAIAVDQAEGDLANRTLLLTPTADGMTYRLVGAEAASVARDLPPTATTTPPPTTRTQPPTTTTSAVTPDRASAAVSQLLDGDTDAIPPSSDLLDLGVGFVGLGTRTPVAVAQRLDATAGLVRMGSRDGFDYWRVRPPVASTADTSVGTPRIRLDVGGKVSAVPVTGLHGATRTTLTLPAKGTLTVAEPTAWASHATVTANGRTLVAKQGTADVAAYDLPAGTVDLAVAIHPDQPLWRWGQVALLVLALFLAIPAGRRRAR